MSVGDQTTTDNNSGNSNNNSIGTATGTAGGITLSMKRTNTSSSNNNTYSNTGINNQQKPSILMKLFGPIGAMKLKSIKKTVWFWGILLGLINFCGSGFQQWGISLTSASKCAFIAGFDLFLTPVFSLFAPTFKHNAKPVPSTWVAVMIAIFGLFLLSGSTLDDMELGE